MHDVLDHRHHRDLFLSLRRYPKDLVFEIALYFYSLSAVVCTIVVTDCFVGGIPNDCDLVSLSRSREPSNWHAIFMISKFI